MHVNDAGWRAQTTYAGALTEGMYASRMRKPATLMLVPMIDIFTVLVTFLLMTAVFSRITILQLDLPSSNEPRAATPPAFRFEVIVRQQGFEVTNGEKLIASIPKSGGEYDLKTLSQLALSLKREYPDADDASVLLEKDVAYDYLIQVMDAIRSTEVTDPPADPGGTGVPGPKKMPLFAHIAVGDAP